MQRHLLMALTCLTVLTMTAGCVPTQTIIVKFEDLKQLKSDFMALEDQLDNGEWAKFDWNTMTITISSASDGSSRPVALGAFQLAQNQPAPGAAANQQRSKLESIDITDTVQQIMRRRQDRLKGVNDLKKQGTIGEANTGELGVPNGASLLVLSPDDRKLVTEENADRRALFLEILRQRKLDLSNLATIGAAFAEVQVFRGKPGEFFQKTDGSWFQKP